MTSQEIRQQFLDFFQSKQHKIVASSPMVIKDDPTLMFTNAGMNQFKEYFLGQKNADVKRIADTQKCLRVSGKHNDLEEVGIDTYHHTMFEMLGNWSFGDYFKKEAIEWAWELLTEVYKIDKNNLYVSVFEGYKDENLAFDQEAYDLWKNIISEDRIILGNKKDNFWEMGNQGPCGPCSEIHVDLRSDEEKKQVSGRDLVNNDHPQVVEIWNLVFMEFNRKADGSLEKLPEQHVDTGMGFERLCMALQGKKSNYDTDVFQPIIQEIEKITQHSYGKDEKTTIAIRVIADHIRAVAFSIADGQLPSNTGAGYVIRRILRRAIRYGFTFLNQKDAFIYQLAAVLSEKMGTAFPELKHQKNLISKVIQEEENSFLRTLGQGLGLLDNLIQEMDSPILSGKKAFELYDTFGFPIDLTALILREKGLELDEEGFVAEMTKQKTRSRAAAEVDTEDWIMLSDLEPEGFVGYDALEEVVKIVRYRKVSSKKDGTLYQLVFNKTPFYPEGGGQVGDTGFLKNIEGEQSNIIDTKKENNLIIHLVKKLPTALDENFIASVDAVTRQKTMANHTATHLMHQALRAVLGTHVEQKGSMVNAHNLRFDFSHFSKLTADEVKAVEDFVNEKIKENLSLIENRNLPIKEAMNKGAMALFGEKYGDYVRTIEYGDSIELCGGTHVQNTADIWYFKITTETAIAAGMRRIEAITGDEAKAYFLKQESELNQVKQVLKNAPDTVKAIESLQDENTSLKKQMEHLLKEKAGNLKKELIAQKETINGIHFIGALVDLDAQTLKNLTFELQDQVENLFFIAGTHYDDKVSLTISIAKNLVEDRGLDAGKIVRDLGKFINGGGGGQAFFATAGGKNPEGLTKAIEQAKGFL
ncbi:MAG: alanine--tRNA ligase [Flavobacteriaceae bacterium]|nr:alanine--tRNA ligase [Flavobacteriaceae bacterium]